MFGFSSKSLSVLTGALFQYIYCSIQVMLTAESPSELMWGVASMTRPLGSWLATEMTRVRILMCPSLGNSASKRLRFTHSRAYM